MGATVRGVLFPARPVRQRGALALGLPQQTHAAGEHDSRSVLPHGSGDLHLPMSVCVCSCMHSSAPQIISGDDVTATYLQVIDAMDKSWARLRVSTCTWPSAFDNGHAGM